MQPVFFLGGTHPHPGLDVDVIVDPINIGVGMMNHIVLHIPHETVTTQNIKGKGGEHVHPFILAETAVGPVVHYIKTYSSNDATQKHAFQDRKYGDGCEEIRDVYKQR